MSLKLNCPIFLLFLFLATTQFSVGKESSEKKWIAHPIVVNWTEQNGLRSENIIDICQGKNGYIWLGTYEGLIRFDGSDFVSFSTKNTPTFPNNSVENLCAAKDGTIWFGGSGPGLGYYRNGKISSIGKNDILKNEIILDISEDPAGGIWVLTNSSIFKVVGEEIQRQSMPNFSESESLRDLCIDMQSELWLGTSAGLYHYNGTWEKIQDPLLKNQDINQILCNQTNEKWIPTYSGDILKMDQNHVVSIIFKNSPASATTSFTIDSADNLWFFNTQGIYKFENDHLSLFSNSPKNVSFRSGPLLIDNEKNFWTICDSRNLVQIKIPRFEYYSSTDGMSPAPVAGVSKRNGNIVITTWNALYDLRNSKINEITTTPYIGNNSVRGLITDDNQNIWIVSNKDGIIQITPDNRAIVFNEGFNFPSNHPRCLHETENGEIWVGTDSGLYSIKKGSIRSIPRFENKKILAVNETKDGSIWVCVSTVGVYRLKNEQLTEFSIKNGLASGIAFHTTQIGFEDFLVSTNMGLSRIKNNQITSINSNNGLPSDSVFYSIQDDHGYTWFATNPGVYRIRNDRLLNAFENDTKNIRYDFYDRSDGIINSEMAAPVKPFVDKDTMKMWLPTREGVLVIDPSKIPNSLPSLDTQIQSIFVNEQKLPFVSNAPLLAGKGVQRVTFHYTAPSFYYPLHTKYKVMLEGFDENWVYIENSREHTYTNLAPGTYKFRVRSKNSDGIWDEIGDSIEIQIDPFFYQTWLFKVSCFLLIFTLIGVLFSLRIASLQKRKQILETLVEKRTKELEIALVHARSANESKNDFLAMMSHEIRTPMNGIIGMLDLLLDGSLAKEEQGFASIARGSATSLLTILNDILDLSKLESKKIVFESIEFSVSNLVNDAISLCKQRTKEKGIDLRSVISEAVPDRIMGDPTRLRQIILNLLSNAIKFTEEGAVDLSIEKLHENDSEIELRFDIKDTGIGIEKAHIKSLFNSFEQGDASTARKYGGSGLGLAICKRLLGNMEGKIWCESSIGTGSTFSFTAKFKPLQVTTPSPKGMIKINHPSKTEITKKSILLVEDTKVNQTIVKHLIKRTPHLLDIADHGGIALEMMQKANYDLVLMDIAMPEMDGVETTHRIREGFNGINPKTIIVALTANAMDGDRERFLNEGMDEYLSKPINKPLFYKTIDAFLSD